MGKFSSKETVITVTVFDDLTKVSPFSIVLTRIHGTEGPRSSAVPKVMLAGNNSVVVASSGTSLSRRAAATSTDKKIGYLIREEDRADIDTFIENYPQLISDYIPVAIIGEGNFIDFFT